MILLPETKEEWELIKKELIDVWELEDSPETWTFVLSQLQNTKMPELECDLNLIWKHYKRWKIAKVLQDEKTVYIKELEAKLSEKVSELKKEQDDGASYAEHPEHVSSGALGSERDVSPLPEA